MPSFGASENLVFTRSESLASTLGANTNQIKKYLNLVIKVFFHISWIHPHGDGGVKEVNFEPEKKVNQ